MAPAPAAWSLTEHLLASEQRLYKAATQHPFLLAGAEGRLSKDMLSRWLADDRLYIHSYIRAAGTLLASLDLPQHVPSEEAPETQLADWLIEALAAVRKEERFFLDVADRYGLGIDISIPPLPQGAAATATATAKQRLPGLAMMQRVFSSVAPPSESTITTATTTTAPPSQLLPWLEGALIFWGTERCYLDAWSWARDRADERGGPPQRAGEDADGGALRREFIPNWSSAEFARFVDRLGKLVDSAVAGVLEGKEAEEAERLKGEILTRVQGPWRTLLEAERAFWPDV